MVKEINDSMRMKVNTEELLWTLFMHRIYNSCTTQFWSNLSCQADCLTFVSKILHYTQNFKMHTNLPPLFFADILFAFFPPQMQNSMAKNLTKRIKSFPTNINLSTYSFQGRSLVPMQVASSSQHHINRNNHSHHHSHQGTIMNYHLIETTVNVLGLQEETWLK